MFKQKLLVSAMLSTVMLSACNDSILDDTQLSPIDSISTMGAELPYSILRSDLIDFNTQLPFEIRNGGYGSSMAGHPTEANQFYAMTDRGPNATYTGSLGKGKMFPTPDYTPTIGLFEIDENGQISLIEKITLKRPDGSLITGLPNSAELGGTGEIPYDASGNPIVEIAGQPYDADTNPLKLDDYGLDSEGLVALADGTFWVSDEYGPHIVHFDAEGKEIGRINAFTDDTRVQNTTGINLPAEFANRWANRGMEGLTITPDGTTLVGMMQSTLYNPSKAAVQNYTLTRIVTVNLQTKEIGQYLYQQEIAKNANSEIAALNDHQFLVIERDGNFLNGGPDGGEAVPTAMKKVYRIDLNGATNLETMTLAANMTQDADIGLTIDGKALEEIADWNELTNAGIIPVSKTEVVDMVAEVQYPHDKMEGLWIIDDNTLGIINDDDFATWAKDNQLEQKVLDSAQTIDRNTLYIVKTPLTEN
ncbi:MULTISPECIES: esterase-like activity of phytase family protein [Thiomicrorhabdus]|uniref:Esterase-like activity of phytase family protein n=1 Tax=Thiomicrorhabdus heinhorstiae TaxID=2748010 RepID=A0ABS0BZ38_9GAMM|nr:MULTISPECIES: esterase-like activity of phytase family protein [Thiomicrorhabdus]MBF6058704.1 esterase-like activity of phytase family protein [Thiomicrorhabdus heinhorstiae]